RTRQLTPEYPASAPAGPPPPPAPLAQPPPAPAPATAAVDPAAVHAASLARNATDADTDTDTADPAAVHAALLARNATVAVAESLTAGLLAAALTETPGASRTFRGGLVVYATDLKASLAGVPAALLPAPGPVRPPA